MKKRSMGNNQKSLTFTGDIISLLMLLWAEESFRASSMSSEFKLTLSLFFFLLS